VKQERLAGARVLVTGAGSGIGLATLRRLRAEGARVAALDRDLAALDDEGEDVARFVCDVADAGAMENAFSAIGEALGGLEGTVAAAGVGSRTADCVSLPLAEWSATIAVNLTGVFLTVRGAVPLLRRAGGGSIVLVASQFGLVGTRGAPAYCASKGGVVLLGKALALDHARDGIRVNVVCPGPVETPMFARSSGARDRESLVASHVPAGRIGEPHEVAAMVAHLLGSESTYMTGSVVAVDGGWTAQ
jgi:meso-butanediol dehydrogenase/(S,S)-butanediol dehydrogenase/diacetyl reductase